MSTNSNIAEISHPLVSSIDAIWQRIKQARAAYNAAPVDDAHAERAHWLIVDPAESEIRDTEATSLRDVEIKLWTALAHSTQYTQDDIDVHSENLAALIDREVSFDFAARVLIGAIRDLRKMGA